MTKITTSATPDGQREREMQRIVNAYHRVFDGDDGDAVINNLKAYFRYDRPAFERSNEHPFDPYAAAIRDGQREVIMFILFKLSQPMTGDGNIEPKTLIKK